MLELFTDVNVLVMLSCPFFSVLLSFFGTCFELDPFYFVSKAFLPSHILQNHSIKIFAARFIITTTCIFDFTWMAALAYVLVYGTVDFMFTVINHLTRGKLSFKLTRLTYAMVNLYLRCQQGLSDCAMSSFIASLMGTTIIASYLSISAYTVTPGAIYWIFPYLDFCSVCILQILLTPFIYMLEGSTGIILNLKLLPAYLPQIEDGKPSNRRKLIRRQISALRPFTFYAGLFDYRFHKLEKSTKISIIANIAMFTITALLA